MTNGEKIMAIMKPRKDQKAKESKEIQEDLDKLRKLNEPTTKNDLEVNCSLDDFIKYCKRTFGVELTVKKSDNPDTYAKLFETTKNDCAEQNGCISCSLDDGDDCCRKLYEESMQNLTTKNDLGVDCISRQAVDNLVWEYLRKATDENIAFYEHFLDLPSVTPQEPRKGHWKHIQYEETLCCSECGCRLFDEQTYIPLHYCPNCGAKMQEVQENGKA